MTRLCLAISIVGLLAAQSQPSAKGTFSAQQVGIRYWFQDEGGKMYTERQASSLPVPLTLHVRGNVAAFITLWTQDRQLTPMVDEYAGVQLDAGGEWVVRNLRFSAGDSPTRILIVFSRSQTEQATNPQNARRRFEDLTSRSGRDGRPQIVREIDESTPGQIGTSVVNRDGGPLAAEIVLRSTSVSSLRRSDRMMLTTSSRHR